MAVTPASGVVAPAPQALPSAHVDVVARAGGRRSTWPRRVVAPLLEPGRALPPGQHRSHYRPPLELVGGNEVAHLDWLV
jgi:hypothetical protein